MISKQRPDVCGAPAIEPIRGKTSLCVYLFYTYFFHFQFNVISQNTNLVTKFLFHSFLGTPCPSSPLSLRGTK